MLILPAAGKDVVLGLTCDPSAATMRVWSTEQPLCAGEERQVPRFLLGTAEWAVPLRVIRGRVPLSFRGEPGREMFIWDRKVSGS